MKGNAACWFEIYVQDMGRAKGFYQAVFQVELSRLGDGSLDMWSFPGGDMTTYGSNGALVCMPGMPSGGNSTLVYFSCEDVATEAARIPGAGGGSSRRSSPSGSTGSSPWPSTRKGT